MIFGRERKAEQAQALSDADRGPRYPKRRSGLGWPGSSPVTASPGAFELCYALWFGRIA